MGFAKRRVRRMMHGILLLVILSLLLACGRKGEPIPRPKAPRSSSAYGPPVLSLPALSP